MHILFIVPYVPSQIRVRSYSLIRALSKHGHRITLVTLYSSEGDLENLRHLESLCYQVVALQQKKWRSVWNCLRAIPSNTPLQYVYSWNPELAKQISSIVKSKTDAERVDAIHVEHLRGARFGISLLNSWKQGGKERDVRPPIIWDSVDCISHLFDQASAQSKSTSSRLMSKFELPRTKVFEGWLPSQFEQTLITSPSDREAILGLQNGNRIPRPIKILTNGVDLDYFKPDQSVQREDKSLVLAGKMSYHANVSMAVFLIEEIMPLVWERFPNTRLSVVGKDPPKRIRQFGSDPRIDITGTVDNMRVYLNKASISVAPIIYGAGIQNKILEAFACEVPVVTTQLGAEPLEVSSGVELLIGDDAASFADQICSLIDNPDEAREIGRRGREFARDKHNWMTLASDLADIYEEAILSRQKLESQIGERSIPGLGP